MDPKLIAAHVDGLVTTPDEARALSGALRDTGQDDLAIFWDLFADFLVASETYLGSPPSP